MVNSHSDITERESNKLNHFDLLSNQYDASYRYEGPFTIYKLEKK